MRFSTRLVERYIAAAVAPYTLLGLLLLTAALLAQQTARLADVLGGARATTTLLAEVLLALLPNITLFTLPMAVLVGTATGFSRLGSDSELTALKAAGVGNLRIVAPVCLLGLVATGAALFDGLVLAPEAAGQLRQTVLRAALYKLESPVEPNTFNTELPGKIIYVREGDVARGQWGRVFIHWLEAGQPTRIVTARTGRIDTTGGQSELVLYDAEVTTLPRGDAAGGASNTPADRQLITERSAQLRVRMNTGREALIRRLQAAPAEPDELGLSELLTRARQTQGAEHKAALQALHKRLALCCAPLALALLGAGLGLRVRRGGRGVGVLLSLGAMLCFYLVLLAGDQMARTDAVPVAVGAWLAQGLSLGAGALLLLLQGRGRLLSRWGRLARTRARPEGHRAGESARRRGWLAMPLGLLDRSLLRALTVNYAVTLCTLVAVFLIFTLFELLRYLNGTAAKLWLLARYLFFLLPLAGVNIAPIAALVTALITYALLARRSEAVAWWAAGQSVYRLALPGLLFALALGGGLWLVQEDVLPEGNRRQEALRAQLRGGAAQATTELGRQWLALPDATRIYTYRYDPAGERLLEPAVFEFDGEGVHVRRIVWGAQGVWAGPGQLTLAGARVTELTGGGAPGAQAATTYHISAAPPAQVFKPLLNKPSELNSRSLSEYLKTLKRERGADVRPYELALARRRADPFAPLVMFLLGLPLALSFGRRTALAALSVAVGAGLAFWGCVSGFQQLGQLRLLPPAAAAFAPLLLFAAVGGYMLTRART
ncbi:MAG TPA: LptF/LptG family permease [Pyrinomonadaceae bacterium]|jgi:LPS export ABC transporter permease LptG